MTPNNRLIPAAAGALALALAMPAAATLSRAVAFDQKVEQAQSIVLGKCTRIRSQWDDQHRFILTYSTFAVEKALKGGAPAEVTVVTPGGKVGSLHQESIGIPVFHEGDERLLFVKNTTFGPTVLYFDQGTYDVSSDEHGEKVIAPVSTGAVRIDPQSGKAVEPESPRTLGEMQRDIQAASSRAAAQQMEMVRTRQRQAADAESPIGKYKFLLILALAGAALATWHLLRR
jgi:hypothetical protein